MKIHFHCGFRWLRQARLLKDLIKVSEVDAISLPMLVVDAWQMLGAKISEDARKLTLDLVRRLYERGLRPGDYWGQDFAYWAEGCQAALDRIEREWIAAGEEPNLSEPICWFAPQPK